MTAPIPEAAVEAAARVLFARVTPDMEWDDLEPDMLPVVLDDAKAVLSAALPALRAEVLAPVAALADEWQQYYDDSAPDAPTLIYGDAATILRAVLADPDAVAERDAKIRAEVAEQIAQAIEADGPDGYFDDDVSDGYRIGQEFAANIARETGR